MIGQAIFNKAPLPSNHLAELPLGAVKPTGWLLDQARTMANGLTGKLCEFWPDVGSECAWAGGNGDSWERAPYYLDGLVPLAWELDDADLKATCMRYIEWIFSSQREDGWFGPAGNTDYWPNMVICKVMIQYFTATGDKRALTFLNKYFKYEYRNIEDEPLVNWAVARAQENMLCVVWLYNITGQKYLLELIRKLQDQSLDWTNHLATFPHIRAMSRAFTWERMKTGLAQESGKLRGTERPYFGSQYHMSHGVNLAMALKMPGIRYLRKSGYKEQNAFRTGWQKIMKYHGVASGMFTCDEHINGDSPVQGTELCATVETMFSMETLLGLGDFDQNLPDLLEKIAFNALPGSLSPDGMTHQYDSQVNQVRVSDEARPWYNNSSDSNLYGLAPNFGCCAANMHQGWPKFISHLWYASNDGGLAAISYAPCTVRFMINGQPVKIEVRTAYPFEESVRLCIMTKTPSAFPLHLRIPAWAQNPLIHLPNGEIMSVEPGKSCEVNNTWNSGDEIQLDLPMEPRVTRWHHRSAAVELGPLLMAFHPEEHWSVVHEHPVAPDYAITTDTPWNYALYINEPMKAEFHPEAASAFGKGESAVKVYCQAAPVPDWQMDGASCAPPPIEVHTDKQDMRIIELVPFGDTCLRIGQFPAVEE